jgi:anti-anti-sigma factor
MLVMNTGRKPRPPILAVASARVGHRFVLDVSGELDIAGAPIVAQQAGLALADGAQELWIDLSALEFIDVAGVHALIDLEELATGKGRRLAVICPPGHVRRALELTGADRRLALFESRFDAHRLA